MPSAIKKVRRGHSDTVRKIVARLVFLYDKERLFETTRDMILENGTHCIE